VDAAQLAGLRPRVAQHRVRDAGFLELDERRGVDLAHDDQPIDLAPPGDNAPRDISDVARIFDGRDVESHLALRGVEHHRMEHREITFLLEPGADENESDAKLPRARRVAAGALGSVRAAAARHIAQLTAEAL